MVLERKIYFYRMLLRNNGQIVEPQTVFTHINSLPFDDTGRYLPLEDGNKRSMFIDSIVLPLKVRIGTKRLRGLPIIEARGQTSPLTIPPDSGLYEPMHVMFFPNNVVGFESNFYAPKPTNLKPYILSKAPNIVDDIELIPLIRRDVYELISRVGEIRAFRLRVQRDMGQFLRELNESLPNAFSVLRQMTDAETIEIVLRCKRNSRNGIRIPFIDRLPSWLSRPEVSERTDKLIIRARDTITEEIQEFDLLQQYILSTKQVATQDEIHRSVNTNAMYNAINEAYTELRQEINLITQNTH